jgi:hypothetical protein
MFEVEQVPDAVLVAVVGGLEGGRVREGRGECARFENEMCLQRKETASPGHALKKKQSK